MSPLYSRFPLSIVVVIGNHVLEAAVGERKPLVYHCLPLF